MDRLVREVTLEQIFDSFNDLKESVNELKTAAILQTTEIKSVHKRIDKLDSRIDTFEANLHTFANSLVTADTCDIHRHQMLQETARQCRDLEMIQAEMQKRDWWLITLFAATFLGFFWNLT